MLGNRKLILDVNCEVYNELKSFSAAEFWNITEHTFIPNSIYLLSKRQFVQHSSTVQNLVNNDTIKVVLVDPTEGSDTLRTHCYQLEITDLVKSGKIFIIGGGDMDQSYSCLRYDSFLPKIFDYSENISAASRINEIYSKTVKPYQFLFLNGRDRTHRKYLLDHFRATGLLNHAIWTCLDRKTGPIKTLDPYYEYVKYQDNNAIDTSERYIKHQLFNNTWGEIYLKAEPYIDTYFSVVTETVFTYPYSFRTEKIWKPIAMGHPWIAVANYGYYRDMRNLGFKTFDHVIDESFDLIENNQDRLERIKQIVEDLCRQDLAGFLNECYNACKYNQQHLADMRLKVRSEFPNRFREFLSKHINE